MSAESENWVERADAGRKAWEALSACEREELLVEVRFEPAPCRACSDCTQPDAHRAPHDCDCDARWNR